MNKNGLGSPAQNMSGLSIVIGGKNTFGKTGDIKIPDWEFEVVNEESTGIPKSPKITLPVHDLGAEYISAVQNGESIVLKGNIREDGEDKPYVVTMTLQLHKIGTEIKEGESVKRNLEGRIDTFEETVDGKQTIKYNRSSLELIVGGDGKNLLEKFASNVL
ncbi:MAG: phage major tail tube protein [Sulfurospirillum sp.]|nr:phage major tail tube protein [Sulfurospirillum sp.]